MTVSTFSESAHSYGHGSVSLNPGTVEEITEDGDYAAWSFTVNVGQGATITSATLTIDINSEGGGEADVYGDDSTNADALAAVAYDISDRTKTTATTHISPSATGSLGIDVTSIVAELIAEGGWASGNRMVLFLNGEGDDRDLFEIDFGTTTELEIDHTGGAGGGGGGGGGSALRKIGWDGGFDSRNTGGV